MLLGARMPGSVLECLDFLPLEMSHDVLAGIQKSSNLPRHAASLELAGPWFLNQGRRLMYGCMKLLCRVPAWACV